MDVRYIGNGMGIYKSLIITNYSKFFAFVVEPYLLTSNYNNKNIYLREHPFKYMNDATIDDKSRNLGFRKADFYLHYKGVGLGISNDNMWWGPGLQSSLVMTNNTSPFKQFVIGTITEQRLKNIGLMGKYTFSRLNKKTGWEAVYLTSLSGQISFYNDQIFTFGFSRNYLTGGVDVGYEWTKEDAQKIIFEGVFIKNLEKLDYTIAGHDPWDQTISTWFDITFPKNNLKLYLEIGFNDNRYNLWDFIVHPDHSMASIIGFRKYGLLKNKNLVFGMEYVNLIKGRHHIFRATPNWYERRHYSDFSYNDRRWGAHSGSDSDDLQIYLGFMNSKWTILPSFNFERHGVASHRPPEIKTEVKLDLKYRLSTYEIGLMYESQFEAHLGFPPDRYFIDEISGKRRTNTFILRLIKNIL
jgi:hypothetical protein